MLNIVNMEPATTTPPPSKLSKSVGFRANPELRSKIESLAGQTQRDISDILRDGVVAFWPEIEALNRQLGRRATTEDVARLRAWMDAGREAHALNIDLADLIRREKAARAITRAEAA